MIDRTYHIEYVNSPTDVDVHQREALWGQCDFWTKTIRIFKRDVPDSTIRHTVLHEVLHALGEALDIDQLTTDDENLVDRIATGLNCILADNPDLLNMFRDLNDK